MKHVKAEDKYISCDYAKIESFLTINIVALCYYYKTSSYAKILYRKQ